MRQKLNLHNYSAKNGILQNDKTQRKMNRLLKNFASNLPEVFEKGPDPRLGFKQESLLVFSHLCCLNTKLVIKGGFTRTRKN